MPPNGGEFSGMCLCISREAACVTNLEMMWFEKVRGGSMHVNHPELVQGAYAL